MRTIILPVLIVVLFLGGGASAGEFRDVSRSHGLKFPRDFYYKDDYRVQWWYFTGHLFDQRGREYGYELTFFVVGLQRREYESRFGVDNIYISHFAVTDVAGGKYYSSEKSDSGAYCFAGAMKKELKVWVEENELEGSVRKMHLRAIGSDTSIDLTLTTDKPVVLNGENGYSLKSEGYPEVASWYFSYTDLKTEGSMKIGKDSFDVSGKSWFDREISSGEMGRNEPGWDWFSLRLDDGREIMLYLMRKKDGTADSSSSGTVVYKDGRYRHLRFGDFKVTVLGHYRSLKTSALYPSGWEISVPGEGLSLSVTPLLEDQEFTASHSTGNYYWEGACRVGGKTTGRAYVELTGY